MRDDMSAMVVKKWRKMVKNMGILGKYPVF
jgi:hypothetical protein